MTRTLNRLVPHPFLSLALVVVWVLLNSLSLGHVILGLAVALGAGRALALVEPEPVQIRAPLAMIRLFGIVFIDIVRSNVSVAHLIITRGHHGKRVSGFVQIPLRIKKPTSLAVLSIIVTATPGTAWLEYDDETGVLLLHVFDMQPEANWVDLIQNRYEALLLEIFPE